MYLELNLLHWMCLCIFIYLSAFKIMDPFIYFGYILERFNGFLGNQPTNNRSIELQFLQYFLEDNSQLDLLNTAKSMPLTAEFRDIVCGHALLFQSTDESVLIESKHIFQLSEKYTLTALDSNDIHFIWTRGKRWARWPF